MRPTTLAALLSLMALPARGAEAVPFIRGQVNDDAEIDISDAVSIVLYLFAGREADCLDAMDANDDGVVNIADVARLAASIFLGAWPLPAPSEECGIDPTPDDLDCLDASVSCPTLFEVRVESDRRVAASGQSLAYDLFAPVPRRNPPPPYPAVVLTHGFARAKEQHRNNARHLAERGMVVLVPNLSSLLGGEADQIRNVQDTADHVKWLVSRGRTPGDPIAGLVDAERVGLAGHSAGGAVTFEAAVALQAGAVVPAAVCLLDAVPWERTLAKARELAPVAFSSLRSEPSSCNASGSVVSLLERIYFPVDDVRIVGASHCDPENPTDALCRLFCGGSSDARRAHYQRILYLFFQDAFGMKSLETAPGTYAKILAELEAAGSVVRSPSGSRR